jgi:hypothetical protein
LRDKVEEKFVFEQEQAFALWLSEAWPHARASAW